MANAVDLKSTDRNILLVQVQSTLPLTSEAYDLAYRTICDVLPE